MQPAGPNADRKGLRGRWMYPPRRGMRVVISPWEYRHLRGWAQVRIAGGVAMTGLGIVTLAFGGSDWKTYGWAMAFLAAAAANLAFAYWELSIARSEAAEPERQEDASRHADNHTSKRQSAAPTALALRTRFLCLKGAATAGTRWRRICR